MRMDGFISIHSECRNMNVHLEKFQKAQLVFRAGNIAFTNIHLEHLLGAQMICTDFLE